MLPVGSSNMNTTNVAAQMPTIRNYAQMALDFATGTIIPEPPSLPKARKARNARTQKKEAVTKGVQTSSEVKKRNRIIERTAAPARYPIDPRVDVIIKEYTTPDMKYEIEDAVKNASNPYSTELLKTFMRLYEGIGRINKADYSISIKRGEGILIREKGEGNIIHIMWHPFIIYVTDLIAEGEWMTEDERMHVEKLREECVMLPDI